jgi:hypothetical protein
MATFREHGFADVLAKPYGIAELGEVLGRVLRGRA